MGAAAFHLAVGTGTHTADQVIRDCGWEQVPLEIRCNAAADQAAGRAARAALVVATCGEDPGDVLVEPTEAQDVDEAEGEVGSMACLLAAPPTGWKFGRALWCVETFFCEARWCTRDSYCTALLEIALLRYVRTGLVTQGAQTCTVQDLL